jgi:ABC-2 type transport system ATP-binding protein
MLAVEVTDLVVRYGSMTAVDGISLSAASGSVLALLGPNGAGKTSTVEAIEGYRTPASGQVRVLGLDPHRDRRRLAPRIGVMLQEGGVYPSMTAREAIGLFGAYYDEPEDVDHLIDVVDLRAVDRTPWRRLSGGEQQRLSLALALVGRPEVAFLDEPSAGIDPAGRRALWRVIGDLRAGNVCVLLTTHDMEEAERLADEVVIIDHGEVVAAGAPAALVRQGGGDLHFAAPSGLDVAALGAVLGAAVEETGPGEYRVAVEPAPSVVAALTAWLAERDVPLGDLRAGRKRLEDVFLRLTTEAGAGDDRS